MKQTNLVLLVIGATLSLTLTLAAAPVSAEIGTLVPGSKMCRLKGGRMVSCQTDASCNFTNGSCSYGAHQGSVVTIDEEKRGIEVNKIRGIDIKKQPSKKY